MNLGSAAGGASAAVAANATSIEVLKQALDAQKLQGQAAVQLIQTAGQVGAQEPGKGTLVDARA